MKKSALRRLSHRCAAEIGLGLDLTWIRLSELRHFRELAGFDAQRRRTLRVCGAPTRTV